MIKWNWMEKKWNEWKAAGQWVFNFHNPCRRHISLYLCGPKMPKSASKTSHFPMIWKLFYSTMRQSCVESSSFIWLLLSIQYTSTAAAEFLLARHTWDKNLVDAVPEHNNNLFRIVHGSAPRGKLSSSQPPNKTI